MAGMERKYTVDSFRAPNCSCGAGPMRIFKSSTPMNPGRYFYRCPNGLRHEGGFVWCDIEQRRINARKNRVLVYSCCGCVFFCSVLLNMFLAFGLFVYVFVF